MKNWRNEDVKVAVRIFAGKLKTVAIKLVAFFAILYTTSFVFEFVPRFEGVLAYLQISILTAIIIGFYLINRHDIDSFNERYLGLKNTVVYVNLIVMLTVFPLVNWRDFDIRELPIFAVYSIAGFSLFFYNLKGCVNQKLRGIIWWPRLLVAIFVSFVVLFYSMSNISYAALVVAPIYAIVYLIIIIYAVVKLLKPIEKREPGPIL